MATTTASRKSKGRRFQKFLKEEILKLHSDELKEDDVRSASMGQSGTDIQLSTKAKELFPFSCEAKNQEKLNIWEALEQAECNQEEKTISLLFFKKNRSDSYVALKASDFMKILKILKDKGIELRKELFNENV